jgi:hypothetical protein
MPRNAAESRRSVLWSFQFLGTAIIGSLIMALVCTLVPMQAQLGVLGAFISILGGLFISYMQQEADRDRQHAEILERLAVPLTLAPQHDLYAQYLAFCNTLTDLSNQTDPILREIAALKLASVNSQVASLADGAVIFSGTETWRAVYEALLASADIKKYQSVSWVRSKEYWQDAPGKQSMKANFDAAYRGVHVERIIILRDDLWPHDSILPGASILPWIEEQHEHGISVRLVRESDVTSEPDLLADFGVYGDRACGTQEVDERSRTVRFSLHFDPQSVRLSKDRWQRLSVYSNPFHYLLDQTDPTR